AQARQPKRGCPSRLWVISPAPNPICPSTRGNWCSILGSTEGFQETLKKLQGRSGTDPGLIHQLVGLGVAKQVAMASTKRWLRRIREASPILLEPIDYLGRVVTGKQEQPPMRLRKIGGPLRSFEISSAEYLAYIRATIGL